MEFVNFIFDNTYHDKILIKAKGDTTIEELIDLYFKRKGKSNLIVDNFEYTYFIYNAHILTYKNNKNKINSFFFSPTNTIVVCRLDYRKELKDFEIIELIKENVYTLVYKAKIKNFFTEFVAIKKIKKEQLKEDIKENLVIDEISEGDFKKEINKFNRELENMKICRCENSVEIYDYFDTEEYFIIIMEFCDNNLFKELAKTKNGFKVEQIRKILKQLNNVFKLMNKYNIAHRDIKLNNILVKYLNNEKTEFKVLLSDYGVSNQLNSMTGKYMTHAGSQIIMAPEILNGEPYTNKCDLWSLGVNIFQLYTKKPPYNGKFDKVILEQIEKKGQTVLNVIKDDSLKDLLSKLLVRNPAERMSWDEYFLHNFFNSNINIFIFSFFHTCINIIFYSS